MAGSITVSSITLDSDNNFSIKSNTGATLFFANTTGIDIANSIGATAITNDKILSVANTKITGNIASSQIAPNQTLNGNVSVTGTLAATGAITGSSTVAGSTGILYPLTSGTAVASTSGTSIDFTSIPSWVKRITVMIAGMSTNGASEYVLRIGDSATISATGYVGAYATNAVAAASTTGFGFGNGSSATATIVSGSFVLTTLDVATFKWTCIGMLGESDTVRMTYSAGSKTLAGALTNVRVTTLNGTDTFDAGSINILYE
jgi:hypothetical protein